MASDKLDFAAVLAVLEAKRAALDTLIGSFRAAMSMGALGQFGDIDVAAVGIGASGPSMKASGPIDLPQGALLSMSLPAAIKLYLSVARRKQTTREIATALKEQGVESTSRNFENTVTTALHRLKNAGDVLKFNDGWALAEFYPENLRSRIAAQGEQKAATKKAKSRKRNAKAKMLALPAAGEKSVAS
jgi:hypothetical protein